MARLMRAAPAAARPLFGGCDSQSRGHGGSSKRKAGDLLDGVASTVCPQTVEVDPVHGLRRHCVLWPQILGIAYCGPRSHGPRSQKILLLLQTGRFIRFSIRHNNA
jgi:hypothetical protein